MSKRFKEEDKVVGLSIQDTKQERGPSTKNGFEEERDGSQSSGWLREVKGTFLIISRLVICSTALNIM